MSRFRNQHNWNEFRWENEIRRDERRINRYFAELSSCLDLPGEEEIIAGLIAENQDPVPAAAANGGGFQPWSYLASRDEDMDYEDDYSSRRPEQALVNLLDSMASAWNMIWVTTLPIEYSCLGLGIACAYGKLLARFADFADADAETENGLKISLGKRTLGDINELADALKFVADGHPDAKGTAQDHLEKLSRIHDRVITILQQSKKVSPPPDRQF